MYTYYIEKEDKIVLYSSKKANLEKALECMPQYVDLKINRTSKGIVEFEGKFYFKDDEEYFIKLIPYAPTYPSFPSIVFL